MGSHAHVFKGVGPLIQRDYWAIISHCRLTPSQLMDWVARRFPEFAPHDRAIFTTSVKRRALEVGDELTVKIRAAGVFRVRVVHKDSNSLTLETIEGHPEAGRITFGSYRNDRGDVIFHIRSQARSSAHRFFIGFLAVGDPMQIHTWTDFVSAVALSAGDGTVGYINAETSRLPDQSLDEHQGPTFIAQGD